MRWNYRKESKGNEEKGSRKVKGGEVWEKNKKGSRKH